MQRGGGNSVISVDMCKRKFGSQTCWLAATTGKAAHLIKGRTWHTLVGMGVRRIRLGSDSKKRLQREWKDVRLLIVDEFSMLGGRSLYWLDDRLRQIRPQLANLPFGGMSIIFVGDLGQLPPVLDCPLFRPDIAKNDQARRGSVKSRIGSNRVQVAR